MYVANVGLSLGNIHFPKILLRLNLSTEPRINSRYHSLVVLQNTHNIGLWDVGNTLKLSLLCHSDDM